jgi:hypothetical protein
LVDVVPIRLDICPTVTLGELACQSYRSFALAQANRLPWTQARGLLRGPCDFALNFFRDVPQKTASVVTPRGPTTIEEYRPLHSRRGKFPIAGPWGDCHVVVEIRPSIAHTEVSATGSPAALALTRCAELTQALADVLARVRFRHSQSLAEIATKYS